MGEVCPGSAVGKPARRSCPAIPMCDLACALPGTSDVFKQDSHFFLPRMDSMFIESPSTVLQPQVLDFFFMLPRWTLWRGVPLRGGASGAQTQRARLRGSQKVLTSFLQDDIPYLSSRRPLYCNLKFWISFHAPSLDALAGRPIKGWR